MSALIADTNKKEPLLLKRFMGYAEQPPRDGRFRTAIDSASQKILVTVRQIFSADPATGQQALPGTSAVAPFPFRSCTGFAGGTDGYRASIKRFNFDCILAPLFAIVNHFSKFLVSLAGVGKKRMLYRLIYGMLSQ